MLVVAILVLLVALLLLGMPLVFAMGSTAVIYLYIADIHLSMLAQRMTSAVDSFLILAIPFFYLAGELMNACKLTDRIVAMAKALVGHIQGGLAQVNIVASMIFAGMSGSATADTAALGSVLIPAMQKEGYHADFSAAVTVASAMIGPIGVILGLVVYRNVSLGDLWRTLLKVTWGSVRILLIIAVASAFSWILVREQVPQLIAEFLATFTDEGLTVLAIMIVFLFLVGLFMIASSAEIVLAPSPGPGRRRVRHRPGPFWRADGLHADHRRRHTPGGRPLVRRPGYRRHSVFEDGAGHAALLCAAVYRRRADRALPPVEPVDPQYGVRRLTAGGRRSVIDKKGIGNDVQETSSQLTWVEFAERMKENPVILLPFGSQEEQGPQAPMGDYMLTDAIVARVAERTDAIAAPIIPFGYADYFRPIPGGIQLSAETFRALFEDICANFLDHGPRSPGGDERAQRQLSAH